VQQLKDTFKKEIVQHITRNLLDIQILRLIQRQPMWGYMVKKEVDTKFDVRLGHGALYPLLNKMEKESFVTSQKQMQGGRARKVYVLTRKGEEYVKMYKDILKAQIEGIDII